MEQSQNEAGMTYGYTSTFQEQMPEACFDQKQNQPNNLQPQFFYPSNNQSIELNPVDQIPSVNQSQQIMEPPMNQSTQTLAPHLNIVSSSSQTTPRRPSLSINKQIYNIDIAPEPKPQKLPPLDHFPLPPSISILDNEGHAFQGKDWKPDLAVGNNTKRASAKFGGEQPDDNQSVNQNNLGSHL